MTCFSWPPLLGSSKVRNRNGALLSVFVTQAIFLSRNKTSRVRFRILLERSLRKRASRSPAEDSRNAIVHLPTAKENFLSPELNTGGEKLFRPRCAPRGIRPLSLKARRSSGLGCSLPFTLALARKKAGKIFRHPGRGSERTLKLDNPYKKKKNGVIVWDSARKFRLDNFHGWTGNVGGPSGSRKGTLKRGPWPR